MLSGRLGLESARVPQADRHGLIWLGRGNLYVADGTLHFATAGFGELRAGDYTLPYQMAACLLLQPGTTVSHDALRLLARHGTGLVAVGEGGVRMYASMPFGPDTSARARRHVAAWADREKRVRLTRRMYAWRLGEVLPVRDLDALRGIEGARVKAAYKNLATQYGIQWKGRRYDRQHPTAADVPNQCINHAATAVQASALVAVAVTGTIPQLGFVHEDSGVSFALDIADLFRESLTLPVAFAAARRAQADPSVPIEKSVRKLAGREIRKQNIVPAMIDRIKDLLDADDGGGNA